MKNRRFKKALSILGYTGLTLLLQFLAKPTPAMLGQDFDQIYSSVFKLYWRDSFLELVKVGLFTAALLLLLQLIYQAYVQEFKFRRFPFKSNKAAAFGLTCFIYMLFFWGTSVYTPALYEGLYSSSLNRILHSWSPILSPWLLWGIGSILILLPALLSIIRGKLKSEAFYAILLLGLMVFPYQNLNFTFYFKEKTRANPPEKTPLVIFVAIDSLRSDHFMSEKYFPIGKKLHQQENSVYFSDHWVGTPRTFPSWLEILTGQFSPQNGVRHMFPGFHKRGHLPSSLIDSLKVNGYQSAVVSDFAGDIFPRLGIEFNELHTPNMTVPDLIKMNIEQFFPLTLPLMDTSLGHLVFPALKGNPAFANPFTLVQKSLEIVANHKEPLFLTIFFSTAHFPYAAPYPYYLKFTDPSYRGQFLYQKNPSLTKKSANITSADKAQVRGLYQGALFSISDALTQMIESLKLAGLWDNTIMVLTADHGEDLYEPGLLHGHGEHLKGENVLRVPWLLKLPESHPQTKKTITNTTRSVDIYPTIMGVMKKKLMHPMAGVDLSPWLSEQNHADFPLLTAYFETGVWFSKMDGGFYQDHRLDYPGITGLLKYDVGYSGEVIINPLYENMINTAKHRGIVKDQFKLIYQPTQKGVEWELYDRWKDPNNYTNIVHIEPKVFSDMKQEFFSLVNRLEPQISVIDDFLIYHD